MAYIKQSIITAQDIMESPVGKVVLDFEIGKCPAYYLRGLLPAEHLRMLQFIRREEAPERWDAVFDPVPPQWRVGSTASHWCWGYGKLILAEHRARVKSLHLGACAIELFEVLEHILCIVDTVTDSTNLTPVQKMIVGLTGGNVLKVWRYNKYGFDGLDLSGFTEQIHGQNCNCNVQLVHSTVFLGFPTLEAMHHAAWLLKLNGAKAGTVGTLGMSAYAGE